MKNLFEIRREKLSNLRIIRKKRAAAEIESDFFKCPSCGEEVSKKVLLENQLVCKCGYHNKISALYRLSLTIDKGTFKELNAVLPFKNPIEFEGYQEKVEAQKEKTGLDEALITGIGDIDGQKVCICIMDSRFMMASMGIAVGEKITRAIEYAQAKKLPLIIFSASGGARMQEGIFSLMQMAKTSAAISRFSESGGLFISVLTHPTTGGVSASFASLGDIMIAEPGALIGFAGTRVIEKTIGQKLPEGFQSSEFLEEHGFVDNIVDRREMKKTLSLLLRLHQR